MAESKLEGVQGRHRASILLWVAVALVLTGSLFPWGQKHVLEESARGDETAYYRLSGLEIHRNEATDRVPDAYFQAYADGDPDHNLPASFVLEHVWGLVMGTLLILVVSAAMYGFRPKPRRRRIGRWAVAIGASAHFGGASVALAAMAHHASGWHASEVGPFIPWIATWFHIAAFFLFFYALRAMDVAPRDSGVMPSLPGPSLEG